MKKKDIHPDASPLKGASPASKEPESSPAFHISPSLDPACGNNPPQKLIDYLNLLNGVEDLTIHLDIMDGQFVPRTSVTPEQYKHVIQNSAHKIDVHLMIDLANPKVLNPYIAKTLWGSIRSISIHPEAANDTDDVLTMLNKIRLMGVAAGIVIDLPIELTDIDPAILNSADLFTVMSVKAGASGQTFNPSALEKVKTLRANFPQKQIIVDGGINPDNSTQVTTAGASTLVMGNAIYSNPNPAATLKALKNN